MSLSVHSKGNVGAKLKGEVVADILAAIRERRSPGSGALRRRVAVCKLAPINSTMHLMVAPGWWMVGALLLAVTARSNAAVLITEFMALNNTTLTDQDGQYSDWIEIYNSGSDTVNLVGWNL